MSALEPRRGVSSGVGHGGQSMAERFVRHRPLAWTALAATCLFGALAYGRMPQRHDPAIPVRDGLVLTRYPGARAEEVEQEVTRKVERAVAAHPAVHLVTSLSRAGQSAVIVQLREEEKDAELVWQDVRGRLAQIADLPTVGGQPVVPVLDKDYGEAVAITLTLASPPVSELEVELRARSIRAAIDGGRRARPEALRADRASVVLVYKARLARAQVLRYGRALAMHLTRTGKLEDAQLLEAPGTGIVDGRIVGALADVDAEVQRWHRRTLGGSEMHPDAWDAVTIGDLVGLEAALRGAARDKYSYRELADFADLVRDRLKRCATVGDVSALGIQDERIELLYGGQRLAQLGVSPKQIVDLLQQRNTNTPGGRLDLPEQSIAVHPTGEFQSEAEIGGLVVGLTEDKTPLYLRDLCEIVRGYADPPGTLVFRASRAPAPGAPGGVAIAAVTTTTSALRPARAVALAVRQVKGTQIGQFAAEVDEALRDLQGVLPDDLRVERASDEPHEVQLKLREFYRSLLEAVLMVVLVAVVFMEWRSAVLVAASIPLTVAMTLGMCALLGVDIQQVSIASLVIALGLLVDDPVVAADAINRELAAGQPREVASWLGPDKLASAILYATLTNVVAFLPLLLVTGITGEFIWSLPVVVSASLVASRVVSMTFMPLLGYYLLRGQRGLEASPDSRFARAYNGVTEACLRRRWLTLGLCALALVAGTTLLPLLRTSFFPKDRHATFTIDVRMEEGTPVRRTRDATLDVMRRIDALLGEDVVAMTAFVGAGGPRFWLSVEPEPPDEAYAQLLVQARDRDRTPELVERLRAALQPELAAARIHVQELESGPPIGVPVQVRVFGPQLATLRRLAGDVRARLRATPGSDQVHDDWDPETTNARLAIDADRAAITGLSSEDVARALATGLSGTTQTSLREGHRLIEVAFRLRPEERAQVSDLFQQSAVSSLTDARIPLSEVAHLELDLTSPKVRRRNHERCITVKCDAVPGVLPSEVVNRIERELTSVAWPPGYRFELGGERAEQAKGFASVELALLVSLIGIYLVLVLQFDSVTKPLVVFAAVPFGVVGGILGLFLFDAPFGFMAFLGVASLAGVIVSHIIVLFDWIEEARHRGVTLHRAVIDSALVRLRPVLVTVLAAVAALIPLALQGGPLWEPMCYVLIVGLLVATLVTKIIVPVLYVIFVEDLGLIEWDMPPAPAPTVVLAPEVAPSMPAESPPAQPTPPPTPPSSTVPPVA